MGASYADVAAVDPSTVDDISTARPPKQQAGHSLPAGGARSETREGENEDLGVPRSNAAPSAENPSPKDTGNKTVLEAHLEYYDTDNDGVIYPLDTFRGFHRTGFNWLFSLIAVFVIHGAFSYWTLDSWIPDLRFPIYMKNINRCKHGSDSATYDADGRYLPTKFEEIFQKHAKKQDDALTFNEIVGMIKKNRNVMDPFGWTASALEWGALYWVAASDEGLLSKERVRACFDGSLWPILEEENKSKKVSAKVGKEKRKVFAAKN